MHVINFSHPITSQQHAAIEQFVGAPLECVIDVVTQFDAGHPFAEQTQALIASIGLSSAEWQTLPLFINLPSHNVIAALVLAELHGRMGYFPAVIRLRPVAEITPPQFEVAEILNLQTVRDRARQAR